MYEIVKKLGINPKKIACYIMGRYMWLTGNILAQIREIKMDYKVIVKNVIITGKIGNKP